MGSPEETVRARFADIVGEAARRAGYDIDSPRGGGKAALARATGMPESSVGRMLRGQTLPDPKYFEVIANAVGLSVFDLMVDAEIISPESIRSIPNSRFTPVGSSSITPEEAAEQLGINDPVDREMFLGMVERLKRERTQGDTASHNDGGAAQM
ncbi:helix-turn-helix transcriptional regulator [Streptomyces sp. NPDC006422]|uniref:helix-turn-helix transcriptional regulator n=1 Tax=unclassified Streptomyces TaxID=2593676 RepID=UPI0033BA9158